jgi:DnaJ-class molecular chaperone
MSEPEQELIMEDEALAQIDRAVEDFRSSIEGVRDSAGEGDFRRLRVQLSSDLAVISLSGTVQLEMASWLREIKLWHEPSYPESEWESCPNCDGNETEDCPDCNGEGILPDGYSDGGMSDCIYCDGTGQAECSECDGLGEVQSDGPSPEVLAVWQESAAAQALSLIENRPEILNRTGVDHG